MTSCRGKFANRDVMKCGDLVMINSETGQLHLYAKPDHSDYYNDEPVGFIRPKTVCVVIAMYRRHAFVISHDCAGWANKTFLWSVDDPRLKHNDNYGAAIIPNLD